MDISRIYIGLPDHLAGRVHWVERRFRTNRKSHMPGGSDIIIEWRDDRIVGYDWIKDPSLYVEKIFMKKLDTTKAIELASIRCEVISVFARQYKSEEEYFTSSFREVWNFQDSIQLPWKLLEPFDLNRKHTYQEESSPWEDFWSGLDEDAQANVLNVMES